LKGEGVGCDGCCDDVPVQDLNQGVDEQTYFLEKGITQLDSLVVKLNVFAKLACQQLHKHLPLECRVPRLLHVVQPLLAHRPALEQL
jgi:hypothetical protein